MQSIDTELLELKKLKKDGSLPDSAVEKTAAAISRGGVVVLPVDNIYAVAGVASLDVEKRIARMIKNPKKRFVHLISSYKMLDDLAMISKTEYDFLNRIWPGEITVIMKMKNGHGADGSIAVRYPHAKYVLDIVELVGVPLVFANIYRPITRFPMYRKNDILRSFTRTADLILLVEEFCRRHTPATIIDISAELLKVVREGKVTSEEIKSLYFLGRDEA
jgi:tRNA threonylcarbamoyl adenosine modification protein (Sua5/YciO/YrdC/YwlC family)